MKRCSVCKEYKLKITKGSICNPCLYNRNKAKINRVKSTVRGFLKASLSGVIIRCRNTNRLCNLDITFLRDLYYKQKGLCALSKRKMTTVVGKGRTLTNLSIDRIDSNKDYTKDNVQLVCSIVNMMKADLELKDLYTWCKDIYENKPTS